PGRYVTRDETQPTTANRKFCGGSPSLVPHICTPILLRICTKITQSVREQ
ncbi:unnamed protein product, partial [Adineta steineri]